MSRTLASARNIVKAWLLLLGLSAPLGGFGYAAGGYRLASSVVFCALLAAAAAYWYSDRVVIGMIGGRELPLGEAPALHATAERLAARAGIANRVCTSSRTAIRARSRPVAGPGAPR